MNDDKTKLLKFILQIVVSIATAIITALSTTACVRTVASNYTDNTPSTHSIASAWFTSVCGAASNASK